MRGGRNSVACHQDKGDIMIPLDSIFDNIDCDAIQPCQFRNTPACDMDDCQWGDVCKEDENDWLD